MLIEVQKSKPFASNMSPHMSPPTKTGIVLGAKGEASFSLLIVFEN